MLVGVSGLGSLFLGLLVSLLGSFGVSTKMQLPMFIGFPKTRQTLHNLAGEVSDLMRGVVYRSAAWC